MDIKKDARAVHAAYELINSKYDLLASSDIKWICQGVINRYDQTEKGAEITTLASKILLQMDRNSFVFLVSDLKKLCEYLIGIGNKK